MYNVILTLIEISHRKSCKKDSMTPLCRLPKKKKKCLYSPVCVYVNIHRHTYRQLGIVHIVPLQICGNAWHVLEVSRVYEICLSLMISP